MKRRNFLSGLLAAPLALKARLAQFFASKPVDELSAIQLRFVQLLAEGKSMREIAEILWPGSMEQWAEKTAGLRARVWLN